MVSRREFIENMASLPVAAWATGMGTTLGSTSVVSAAELAARLSSMPGEPDDIARSEDYWFEVAQAFPVDRSLTNLNNGGVSPTPISVQYSLRQHQEFSNLAPAHNMWQILEPQREVVREKLAQQFGVDKEEIALTRNASEGLHICQLGLDLQRGDEVLTTNQDYPRMLWAFEQRQRREGLVLKKFPIPTPCEDLSQIVRLFEKNITPQTKLILVSQVVFLTGQILPVREVAALGRSKGIPVIVDGSHALAHLDFKISDLDCDYYGAPLHKWLCAPHGTGLLYVRRDKIKSLWPLMPAPAEKEADIRKFEEIGTHPAAPYLAISEALTFHQGIGAARKQARLLYLRDSWAKRLLDQSRVRLLTSLKPGCANGLATFQIEGIDPAKLCEYLWSKLRILVTPITHDEFAGVRVAPSVYNTMLEIDRFCNAVENVIKNGLPA